MARFTTNCSCKTAWIRAIAVAFVISINLSQAGSYFLGISACSEKNGGCTHLCLATPNGRSCQCPDQDDTTRPCLYGKINTLDSISKYFRECSGSVVECFTRDQGVAGLYLTGVTALCPCARPVNPCLV